MHTQIDERAEVYDVAHGAGQLHAWLQIVQTHDVTAQQRLGQAVTDVASRLTQLGHNIVQRRLAHTQRLTEVPAPLALTTPGQTRQLVCADLGSRVAAGVQQGLGGVAQMDSST